MVTDAYLDIRHHPDIEDLVLWAGGQGLRLVAIDVVPGCLPLEDAVLPQDCVMLFGQEGPGLSDRAIAAADSVLSITQRGSTRSLNVAAAAAIAMHSWVRQHPDARFDARDHG